MSKTIWYISKYCAIPDKKSKGSRGWHLMKEFVNKGYQSVIISSDSNNSTNSHSFSSSTEYILKEGVHIMLLKTLKYSVAKSFLRILSWFHFEWNLLWLKKNFFSKPDVIIVSSLSILTIINGYFLKKKYKCKLVFEIRDIWPLTLTEEGGFSSYNPAIILLQFLEIWGYKKSDLIIGTMPNLSEHVKNVIGSTIRAVHCIPMGVDLEFIKNTQSISPDYIKRYLNPDYFNIVYAGTIGITNALDTFFKAANELSKNSKIRFVVVGDGPLKKKFQKEFGHLPNLVFAPRVYENQIQSVLHNTDVLYLSVFKSKIWNFGQSMNKVIDYMLSNKPIIASYTGYPSMINEASCGYFIPAENPHLLVKEIKRLYLMTKSELNEIGKNGRDWLFKNRTYQKLADDYLRLLFDYKK
jgi:glycosyltransferase involved in cell wall biosynthesis